MADCCDMPRATLPPGWPQVLRAIAEGPEWKVRPKDLARRMDRVDHRGKPLASFVATLDAMHDAAWLYRFEELRREYVTLSGQAAERLGAELVDTDAGTRWSCPAGTVGGRWPRQRRREICETDLAARHFDPDRVSVFNLVPDPLPTPDRSALLREQAEAILEGIERKAARGERITRGDVRKLELCFPILLLIGSGPVWREKGMGTGRPGAAWSPPRECETCKLLPLPSIGICLRCLRWGMDHFFQTRPARKRA